MIANFIGALGGILDIGLKVYMWIIIISALLSWVNPDPYNPIVRFIYRVTEPVLRPIRRLLGIRAGIDLSPLVAILIIWFLRRFVVASLMELALRMR